MANLTLESLFDARDTLEAWDKRMWHERIDHQRALESLIRRADSLVGKSNLAIFEEYVKEHSAIPTREGGK